MKKGGDGFCTGLKLSEKPHSAPSGKGFFLPEQKVVDILAGHGARCA